MWHLSPPERYPPQDFSSSRLHIQIPTTCGLHKMPRKAKSQGFTCTPHDPLTLSISLTCQVPLVPSAAFFPASSFCHAPAGTPAQRQQNPQHNQMLGASKHFHATGSTSLLYCSAVITWSAWPRARLYSGCCCPTRMHVTADTPSVHPRHCRHRAHSLTRGLTN